MSWRPTFFRPLGWIVIVLATVAVWWVLPQSLRLKVARLEPTAYAATFTVTNTDDDGPGSLREAIRVSNLNPETANLISFDIPGSARKITLVSALPAITSPITIDGTTQPGFLGFDNSTYVELSGGKIIVDGLTITAGHSTVKGLQVDEFVGVGIKLQANGGNLIDQTYVSTSPGNGPSIGIQIDVGAPNNTIQNSAIRFNVEGARIESSGNKIAGCMIVTNFTNGLVISGSHNTIGLPTISQASNVIQNSREYGIELLGAGATENTIQRNDITGNGSVRSPQENLGGGLLISDSANNNLVGGADYSSMHNFIDHNAGPGVQIVRSSGNTIRSNTITGSARAGVRVEESTANTVIGNEIGFNYPAGVRVDSNSTGISILENAIYLTAGSGIDLDPPGLTPNDPGDGDSGANNLQNFPLVASARGEPGGQLVVTGTLNSTPNSTFHLEFFSSGACAASDYRQDNYPLGCVSLTSGSDGNASFRFVGIANFGNPRGGVTATATDSQGNTSEFSQCVTVVEAGFLSLDSLGYGVNENAGSATITVVRTASSNGPVTVDYATSDGTAKAGQDYVATSGTLAFADGETSKTFAVPILDDTLVEGSEAFNVTLSNPTNGAALTVGGTIAKVVIFDNESLPPPTIFALGNSNNFPLGNPNELLSFNSDLPEHLLSNISLTNLRDRETIEAIAFRPATGRLYGVGNQHLYTINTDTGVVTQVGAAPFSTELVGFANCRFNPVTDRLRVITSGKQNLQVDPDTGQVVSVDGPLTFNSGDPNDGMQVFFTAIANDNNFAGATSTTTFVVGSALVLENVGPVSLSQMGSAGGSPISPDSGRLSTIEYLAVDGKIIEGFDIAESNTRFAVTSPYPYRSSYLEKGGLVIGHIVDDLQITDIAIAPSPRVLQFASGLFSVNENAGNATLTVNRTGSLLGPVSVNYATSDGTATAGQDYTTMSGTLQFAAGETRKSFTVPLLDDSLIEGVEAVNLTLSNATNGAAIGPQSTATIAIMDEPAEVGTNPIDNADFFVRQHYADFLNRPPDEGGLTFWTNHITECFNDAACVNQRRVGTSAAYFIENEFQQTGFFIHRFYGAALGRRPGFVEFTADRGKVVGGANLESGKQAFATEFVQRQDFRQQYPLGLDAAGFVDALIATAGQASGIADLATRRTALISQYNLGANQTDSRVRVIRALIDDSAFSASQYNSAFVLMQYFGYLQRGPDQAGYDFWLDHVNNRNPNNYRSMVCAFITSSEYQRRFSPIITRSDHDCSP